MKKLFKSVAVLLATIVIFLPQATFASTENQVMNEILQHEVTTPNQLDQLWVAYYASKDPRYIDKIIHTYADIANEPAINENDVFMLAQAIFSPEYKEKNRTKLIAIPNNYKNQVDFQKMMLASNALWSLASNSVEHTLVKKQMQKYILNSRNKKATIPLQKMLKMANS